MEGFPKIAHLSWKTEELPAHWAPCMDSWKRLHPDWQVNLWTDKTLHDFMEAQFPDRVAHYDKFKYNIQRVDMARYCLLEHFGGIWSDLDIEPTRNLEDLLNLYFNMGARVLITENATGHKENTLSNCFIASVPGHPFWAEVWKVLQHPYKYTSWWKKIVGATRHYEIIFTSGPGIINAANKLYGKNDVMPLPRSFVQFSPHWEARPAEASGAVARMLQGQSWHNQDSTIATHADRWWASRDLWAIPSLVVFLVLTVVFAALFGVYYSKYKKN